jgi:hypothetical protein
LAVEKSAHIVVENPFPVDRDTHQVPFEGWKLAMSSLPSPSKSPTVCEVHPEAVTKSAHRVVENPFPLDRDTHQVPFEG